MPKHTHLRVHTHTQRDIAGHENDKRAYMYGYGRQKSTFIFSIKQEMVSLGEKGL